MQNFYFGPMTWVVSANTQFATVTENTISGVLVSPGNADTLVRRGEIANHHSIAYSLSNTSAKNYQNRLTCVEVIVCDISVAFILSHCTFAYQYIPTLVYFQK